MDTFWPPVGGCFSGHLPKPFLDHFLMIFGTAGGQILALISPILEPDFVTFLSFLDTARGHILCEPQILEAFSATF